jgi:prepilin peptidase CpaA
MGFLPDDYMTMVISVVPVATLYASLIDYRERRVPNWLNGSLVFSGLLVQCSYFGFSGLGQGLLGMLIGFGILIVPWILHTMGAGDVKLMMGVGAWFGPWMTFVGGMAGMLIGGVMAVVMILLSGKAGLARANFGVIFTKLSSVDTAFSEFGSTKSFGATTTLLPYGIPLTIGSLLVLFASYFEWAVI